MRALTFSFACAWLWFGANAAIAQLLTNPVQDYINRTNLLNSILSNSRATAMSQQRQTEANRPPQATGPRASVAVEPTKFTRAATGFLLPKVLAEKSAPDEARRQQSEQLFTSLIELYEQTAKKDGFPANDLAYAFEYFVVNTYMTAHDLHDVAYEKDPRVKRGRDMFERLTIINQKKLLRVTLDQEHAIYGQLKDQLARVTAVQQMTDAQKQEVTELLAIMFGLNLRSYMDGVNREDDRATEQARQVARSYLEKITGAPVDRIAIGADGLRLQ
jgi:hypothetical protein